MEKSFISVKWMLIIAVTLILLIGLVTAFQILFPFMMGTSCIQRQRSYIDDLITTIEEVRLTGEEQIIRFRVLECTECIWYNETGSKLEVEYEAANESFLVPPVAWNGDIDKGNGGRPICKEEHLVGQKTCTIYIKVNSVWVEC